MALQLLQRHRGAAHKLLELLHFQRRPRVRTVQHGYEKASLTVRNEPIPWNAEAVVVEVVVEGKRSHSWPKSDFTLHLDGVPDMVAESFQPAPDGGILVTFRLPPLLSGMEVEMRWRGQPLGCVALPFLSRQDFLRGLRLEAPALLAHLGSYHLPCQAVVGSQCRGVLARARLVGPSSLLPLLDLRLSATFTYHGTNRSRELPIVLTRCQLLGSSALLSASILDAPESDGLWSLHWTVEDHLLARNAMRTLSAYDFQQSLYVIDARYASENREGQRAYTPYLPPRENLRRVGPCFRIASLEPGVAGLCSLDLRIHYKDSNRPPQLLRQEVPITDGPSLFAPLLMSVSEFEEVASFELLVKKHTLGALPGCCRPVVSFTGEGGFKEPPDFDWTPVAEQELNERLNRLFALPEM